MMELIVNVTENWGIGKGDALAVRISADLKRFRSLTMGKTVILGRKTLQTFPGGRPLKGRRNLILSRDPDFQVEGAEVFHSVEALLAALSGDAVVIGGESIYRQLLPYCTKGYVTKTYLRPDCDRFFPNLDELPGWHITEASPMQEEADIRFQYLTYENAGYIPYAVKGVFYGTFD